MNINELDSYNLSDAVKFNDSLNPAIWNRDKMKPEVRKQLLAIADDFRQFLGLSDLEIKDITVSGSNAGYTYTPHSDIDLHLVVDIPRADQDEVYRELFDAKKYQYNEQHDISIHGYDVELYVENANKPPVSKGVYSVANDNWVQIPKKRKAEINDDAVRSKFEDIGHRIEDAVKSGDYVKLDTLTKKIKNLRQAGLDQHGELGAENLAYKMLRSQGMIKKLHDAKTAAKDQQLSLKERAPKQVVKYGFRTEDLDTDGVMMTRPTNCSSEAAEPDTSPSDEDILKDFISFCVKELKIDQMPRIKLRKDPQWSKVHRTFGRYINDHNSLEVAWGQRHIMDVLRTVAHELTHKHQHERDGDAMGPEAGETGSKWENEANARAGILMRDYGRLHPEYFTAGQAEHLHGNEIDEGWREKAAGLATAACIAGTPGCATTNNPIGTGIAAAGAVGRALPRLTPDMVRADAQQELRNYLRAKSGQSGEGNLSRLYQLEKDIKNQNIQKENASGYIPTKKQAKDPRYSMALTVDIKPGQVGKEANKLGLKTNKQGKPATLMKTANTVSEGKNSDLNDPPGPEFKPTMPRGTVKVDVSDVYDWYKLGKNIANLDRANPADFGKGPPSTIVSFGDEDTEHQYIKKLERLGLTTTDIDPVDPNQPAGLPRQSTDPTYNVDESAGNPQVDLTPNFPNYQRLVGEFLGVQNNKIQFRIVAADLKPGHKPADKIQRAVAANRPISIAVNYVRNRKVVDQDLEEDDLIESLRQEFALLEDEFLGEINMGSKNLRKEAAKTGAIAGMEFEMIVPGVEGDGDEEMEPDYEYDESVRSIQDAYDFFYDGDYNSRGDVIRLRDKMTNEYYEWLGEAFDTRWESDEAEFVYRYLVENASAEELAEILGVEPNEDGEYPEPDKQMYRDATDKVISEGYNNYWYEQAREAAQEDFNQESDLESDWLESRDLNLMSDIENEYNMSWPHWRSVGNGGDRSIDDVANDFQDAIGRDVQASGSYHSGRVERPSPKSQHYVVEPDGSLEGDDSDDRGLEFVSPPLPIDVILNDLNKVKRWAKSYGCYTNDSTGLHINISVPNYSRENLDFVKLALLMGDEYVLDNFGRAGNTYAKSAMKLVRDQVRNKPEEAESLLNKMKGNLDSLASKAIHSGVTSKYTSINTKDGHIEFRSPGGDWLDENFDKIENTLLRFTVAMSAALNPEMYREEYLKKLYKLLTQDQKDNDTIKYFSEYVAGKIPKAALRSFVKQAQLERKLKKGDTEGKKYWWRVGRPGYGASVEVVATSKEEAIEKGKAEYPDWASAKDITAKPMRPYEEPVAKPKYEIYNKQTGNTVEDVPAGINDNTSAIIYLHDYQEQGPHGLTARQARDMFSVRLVGTRPTRPFIQDVELDIPIAEPRAQTSPTGQWRIIDGLNRELFRFRPTENTRSAANELATLWVRENDFDGNYQVEPAEEAQPGSTTDLAQQRATPGTFTGAWKIVDANGNELYRFSGIGNQQRDANRVATQWMQNNGYDYGTEIEVLPIMS